MGVTRRALVALGAVVGLSGCQTDSSDQTDAGAPNRGTVAENRQSDGEFFENGRLIAPVDNDTVQTGTTRADRTTVENDVVRVYSDDGTYEDLPITEDIGTAVNTALELVYDPSQRFKQNDGVGRGRIVMPAGRFEFDTTVRIDRRWQFVTIEGAGPEGTRLEYTGTGNGIELVGEIPPSGSTITSVVLRGFELHGGSDGSDGLFMEDTAVVDLYNVKTSSWDVGFHVARECFGVKFYSCIAMDCRQHGFAVRSGTDRDTPTGGPEITLHNCGSSHGGTDAQTALVVQDAFEVTLVGGRYLEADDCIRLTTGAVRSSTLTLLKTHMERPGENTIHVVDGGGVAVRLETLSAGQQGDLLDEPITIDRDAESAVVRAREIGRTPRDAIDAGVVGSVQQSIDIADRAGTPTAVFVPPGAWNESVQLSSASAGLTITGAGRNETTLAPSIGPAVASGGGPDDVTIERLGVRSTDDVAVSAASGGDMRLRDCRVEAATDAGIDGFADRLHLDGCVFESDRIDGPDVSVGTAGSVIRDCRVSSIDLRTREVTITGNDGFLARGGGTARLDGDGSARLSVHHGLDATPDTVSVSPRLRSDATPIDGIREIDDSRIEVAFAESPAVGTENVAVTWTARIGRR